MKFQQLVQFLVILAPFFLDTSSSESYDVCVVGGGVSGLSLGHLLRKKGHKAIILEAQNRVGGKAKTFRQRDEVQVDLCALIFHKEQTSVMGYMNQFNLTPVHFDVRDVRAFNRKTGLVSEYPDIEEKNIALVNEAAKRYIELHANYTKHGALSMGYTKARLFPEILLPVSEFLEVTKLEILAPVFRRILTGRMVGGLEEVPALYALRFVDSKIFSTNTRGGYLVLSNGLDTLMNKMAEGLNVKLNSRVVKIISRHPKKNFQIVVTQSPDGQRKYKCSKTIIAFPPLLKSLENVLKLKQEERDLFGLIGIQHTISAAVQMPSWNHTVYYGNEIMEPNPTGDGYPVLFAKLELQKFKNIFVTYCWRSGVFNSTPCQEEQNDMRDNMAVLLHQFNKDSVKKPKIFHTVTSEFFPHVNTTSLENGFYEKFDKIQGKGGVYYSSSIFAYEIMDYSIKVTEYIVDKYF